jgi:hypothetical protein
MRREALRKGIRKERSRFDAAQRDPVLMISIQAGQTVFMFFVQAKERIPNHHRRFDRMRHNDNRNVLVDGHIELTGDSSGASTPRSMR